jgi:tyrosyl-tRNA synthetase
MLIPLPKKCQALFLKSTILPVNTVPNDPPPLRSTSGSAFENGGAAENTTDFIDELEWRGLFAQCSDVDALRKHLASGDRKAYVGLDPTSDSLTIGNLCTLILLAHFQRAGHHPVVVAGGGTGLIGDPGGKSTERPLLPLETIRANIEGQLRIYDRLLPGALVVNNADWLVELSYVNVLRDVGKYFSVNEMIKRDVVRNRLEADGISYTEFSYMVLQAYDFAHLHQTHDVTLQMGGSDQWGNILSGVDLIRRIHGAQAFALTCPLLLKSDGTKFGKSETGAVWLTADRTTPYAFHQFWLNADDNDIERYLKVFSFRNRSEIAELLLAGATDPGRRIAQRALADELTSRLHGSEAMERAEAVAKALFTGDVRSLDAQALREVRADVPTVKLPRTSQIGKDVVALLVDGGIAPSNRQAREWLTAGSISINGEKVGVDHTIGTADVLEGGLTLVRRGKKNWSAIHWVD